MRLATADLSRFSLGIFGWPDVDGFQRDREQLPNGNAREARQERRIAISPIRRRLVAYIERFPTLSDADSTTFHFMILTGKDHQEERSKQGFRTPAKVRV